MFQCERCKVVSTCQGAYMACVGGIPEGIEACPPCGQHANQLEAALKNMEESSHGVQQANYSIALTLLKRWYGGMSGDGACKANISVLHADTGKFLERTTA